MLTLRKSYLSGSIVSKWLVYGVKKSCMVKLFKVPDKPTQFNVIVWKSIDTLCDCTLQLTCKKLSLVKFWYNITEEKPQLPEKTIEILLISVWSQNFFHTHHSKSHTAKRLSVKAHMRIQLSYIRAAIREMGKFFFINVI